MTILFGAFGRTAGRDSTTYNSFKVLFLRFAGCRDGVQKGIGGIYTQWLKYRMLEK